MGAFYTIDATVRTVFSNHDGSLSDADLNDHQLRLMADPAFDRSFNQLLDFRGIAKLEVTPDGVRRVASRSPFGADTKRALVADNSVTFGFGRMFELSKGGPEAIEVFRSMEEARKWLGLD